MKWSSLIFSMIYCSVVSNAFSSWPFGFFSQKSLWGGVDHSLNGCFWASKGVGNGILQYELLGCLATRILMEHFGPGDKWAARVLQGPLELSFVSNNLIKFWFMLCGSWHRKKRMCGTIWSMVVAQTNDAQSWFFISHGNDCITESAKP